MNTAISPVSLWVFRLGKCYSLMAICMPTKVYLVLWIWHPIAAFSCIVYFIVSVGLLIIIQNKSRHNILLWLVSTAWLKPLNTKKLFSYTSSKKIGLQGRPHAVLINIMIQSAHLGFCFPAQFGRIGTVLYGH